VTDELLKTLVLGAPNVAVALAALWWTSRLIGRMVNAQEKLVTQLLELCARNEELAGHSPTLPSPKSLT